MWSARERSGKSSGRSGRCWGESEVFVTESPKNHRATGKIRSGTKIIIAGRGGGCCSRDVGRNSIPNIACIQTPRNCRIGRAFDDGAAVGKNCHFIRLAAELQHKLVVPHRALGGEPVFHFGESNRAPALM